MKKFIDDIRVIRNQITVNGVHATPAERQKLREVSKRLLCVIEILSSTEWVTDTFWAEQLADRLNNTEKSLKWALEIIEREVDFPKSCGACGTPNANCDGDCVDAAYFAKYMSDARKLLPKSG